MRVTILISILYLQLELNLERLRMAVDDLINKLAKTFTKPKLQSVFLINNYDMTIAVLKVRIYVLFGYPFAEQSLCSVEYDHDFDPSSETRYSLPCILF